MSIVGILPLAGTGSRLGLPFPKALAPTFTHDGIQPLYAHAYDRLRAVADRIAFVVADDDPCLAGLPGEVIRKRERGELPSSLALVARTLRPDDLCAVALPDTLWWPSSGFRLAVKAYHLYQPTDGVLLTFDGSSHILDEVMLNHDGVVAAIERHADPPALPRTVRGWGAFVASAGCLKGLTDDRPLGPQLAEYRFHAVHMGHEFYDLGTPRSYEAHISLSKQMDSDQ